MKKLAFFIFLALSFTITALGSEVAEVAKKERARRQATGKPAKTFTNQDIANLKSSLAFEVSQLPEQETEEREITTLPAVDRSAGESTAPNQDQENSERQQEVDRLREEREALEQQARDAQQTINQGGGYHTRNLGNQFKTKREAEARIREIDEKLKKEEGEEEQQEQ